MPAIKVENLGKSYLVGHNTSKAESYTVLRDVLARNAKNLARKTRDMLTGRQIVQGDEVEEFWALRDINFEIQPGDRVGIIGRNGAGKSTLLKILSRIAEPTTGRVTIKGRVASLLEVGTGFHPELTGRENIFLNGAILGMSRKEIQRKFDEIVDFAEVEKFLDTPVKRYSSGMYVRLAFAVAAHLEPEILVVDEVLAVGDAAFQKKCLGKMEEVGNQGRTVLFVSHNMPVISNLCGKSIVLASGQIEYDGSVSQGVSHYYLTQNTIKQQRKSDFSSDAAELIGANIIGLVNNSEATIHDDLIVRMRYKLNKQLPGVSVPNFHFFSGDGRCVFVSSAEGVQPMGPGIYDADCKIPCNFLNEGLYFVGVALTTYPGNGTYQVEFYDRNALTFNLIDPMDDRAMRYDYVGPTPGVVRPKLQWSISRATT